ncbi:flagellar motor switch protein FliG [Chthonomonas calidirosea]|jgi:flagellar motor switch protein FliG|uniref:Flagellar motor switch protein FliG n=1 Tax=Chthonomonas calidirosea (strain DSM 23976 / ICMP 18418 / T49) TaxID=1303518 RepID=S0EYN6_CHTCT|nr:MULTISPECIES: flagellar motor switch protein FliG [Chthonomonas]CCW35060.1 flagellar motor switch protein FliG [Chthonomonas calidirosea T49]CEK20434.1 flagellar motor switch protein FliG [Chthonomonas calidirosea]CEK20436.1 flagellar motor switch protein FliG [Chthonomonas calidirosea]CEK20925.1 flagellar motor switch protein FliG [Chthonomonas calidirosea]HLH80795.1 flagellar motor switch protein FliG [Chthonomonas sp.]
MPRAQTNNLTNRQKAAVLMVALGPEAAARVFKHLREDEIENITLEVARLGRVSSETRRQIIAEFHEMCLAQEVIAEGGIDQARKALEAAFGADKANEVVSRVSQALQVMPFDFVKKTDPTQLLSFIVDEHPQTIALVLSHLNPNQAATVLSGLPQELRAEVARRIAIMDRTPPEVIREIERVLERKLSTSVVSSALTSVGGVKSLVEILNWVDRTTEKTILENLSETTPDLAEEVKKLMFVFEDIVLLDDGSIQKVLREVDTKELALALKGVGEEVQNRIFKNMSERAATMLKEDMEFMGPVRLRNVEEAQQRIVGIIRRLEEAGEIVIARGGGEEIII